MARRLLTRAAAAAAHATSFASGALRHGQPQDQQLEDRAPAGQTPASAAEQRAARLASGYIVIVCGGQGYDDRDLVFVALDSVRERQAIPLLVHGACIDRKTGQLLGVAP
jgi:hypothetical protein